MPGSSSNSQEYFYFTALRIKDFRPLRSIDELLDACKCEPFEKCKWSNETVFELKELPKESQLWKEKFTIFRRRICDPKLKSVHCCYDDEIPPTDDELKILNGPETGRLNIVSLNSAFTYAMF